MDACPAIKMDSYKLFFTRLIAKWAAKLQISTDLMHKVYAYALNTKTPLYRLNGLLLTKLGVNISRRQLESFAKEFKQELERIKNSPERNVSRVNEESVKIE